MRAATASEPRLLNVAAKLSMSSLMLQPLSWPSENGTTSRLGMGVVLGMRRTAERLVEKVTLAPMETRRFANWRDGFMWPCAGKVTRRILWGSMVCVL